MPIDRTGVHRSDPLEPTSGDDAARSPAPSGGAPARDALSAAMAGPLARSAALTYERLLQVEASDFPPAWTAILVRAAGTPRSPGLNGREGILSPIDAHNAALAYRELSPSERAALAALVDAARAAGQDDASPAQALLLKALAARRTALARAEPSTRKKTLDEVAQFARGIHGLDARSLLLNTSLLDLDETVDSRRFDPLSLEDRPGALADRPLSYTGADNDGLFQRYERSCGPASIEVLLGERDPAYALRRRSMPMDVDPAEDDDLQTRVLQQFGMTPASRVVPAAVMRLRAAMAPLEASGRLSSDEARQVASYLLGSPGTPKGPLVDRALATLRAANDGFPDARMTEQIHAYVPPMPGSPYNDIGFKNLELLLNRIIGEPLGVDYKLRSLYQDSQLRVGSSEAAARAPDHVRSHLDLLEQNLADGIDVIFGTSEPDHFWSMSNVDGGAPARRFLVHDTWSGRTGWVDEPDLVDGSFARAFLGQRKTSTFIDLLYLVG